MATFTLEEVLRATGGTTSYTEPITFQTVSTDTRDDLTGALFVALKGLTFDGHDFLDKAKASGALGAIVEKGHSLPDFLCIEVENTLTAYQDLGHFHRHRFDIPIVAITGSSGKTTTKEMIATILGTTYKTLKTEKNYNNEIGVPKMLLQLTDEYDACVLEMGMRGLGQIDELAKIADPTVAVITNVGTSHIELLGSQEAIADAKGELIQHMGIDGVSILNGDDHFVSAMQTLTIGQVLHYGIQHHTEVRGQNIRYTNRGIYFTADIEGEQTEMFLPMIGIHNVYDALAAVTVGLVLDVPTERMKDALGHFKGIPMRQEIVNCKTITILNDAYNANPSSMAESIKALPQLGGKRNIAILGDMLELGEQSKDAHEAIGKLLGETHYDMVFTFGDAAKAIALAAKDSGVPYVYSATSHLDLANAYCDVRAEGDVLLVKGSRGLRMERVIEDLLERDI